MNTRKRKENLLEHTVPADKPPKREKIDEGATTKLVMDALTNLSQSVNDSEQLQHYLPDVQDLKTLDARGHVSGGIIRFWSNYLIHNVINNTAGSNSKQDIIIDCHWMGTLYFHSNREESTLMDSLEETVHYFEDDNVVWKDLTIANSKLVFIPYSILNDHWSLLVICNLNKLKDKINGVKLEEDEEPFIFQMDSIHHGKEPYSNDHKVHYLLLIRLWVLLAKENPTERFRLRQVRDAIEWDDKHHLLVDVIAPQQPNGFDCALYVLKNIELLLNNRPQKSKIITQYFDVSYSETEITDFRKNIKKTILVARKAFDKSTEQLTIK